MQGRNFMELIRARWAEGKFVCVGLDSEFGKIPAAAHRKGNECAVDVANTMVAFNRAIVEATHDLVCAYKPNIAFFEACGVDGLAALQRTIIEIHAIAPKVPVILDAKRADIGNTNNGYVAGAFKGLEADAITVHPYLGQEALRPFLDQKDKGVIVLCRTSNPGAGEFQDLQVGIGRDEFHDLTRVHAIPTSMNEVGYLTSLSNHVAYCVSQQWNANGNCALVVGATYPDELRSIRAIVGDMPILIPGIGKQGGDIEQTVKAGKDRNGTGMIINNSSGIIFAGSGEDFADVARIKALEMHEAINQYR